MLDATLPLLVLPESSCSFPVLSFVRIRSSEHPISPRPFESGQQQGFGSKWASDFGGEYGWARSGTMWQIDLQVVHISRCHLEGLVGLLAIAATRNSSVCFKVQTKPLLGGIKTSRRNVPCYVQSHHNCILTLYCQDAKHDSSWTKKVTPICQITIMPWTYRRRGSALKARELRFGDMVK